MPVFLILFLKLFCQIFFFNQKYRNIFFYLENCFQNIYIYLNVSSIRAFGAENISVKSKKQIFIDAMYLINKICSVMFIPDLFKTLTFFIAHYTPIVNCHRINLEAHCCFCNVFW